MGCEASFSRGEIGTKIGIFGGKKFFVERNSLIIEGNLWWKEIFIFNGRKFLFCVEGNFCRKNFFNYRRKFFNYRRKFLVEGNFYF